MFTGIVEEVGKIKYINGGGASFQIGISCEKVLEGTKLGDSIAVNGICLTVTRFFDGGYEADVMPETFSRTNLKKLGIGAKVNLERAMAADGRFGGHIVSGHIDGTGTIKDIQADENAVWYTIEVSKELLRYIVEKGSIAIDGISLTVAKVTEVDLSVSVIPHTRANTALVTKQAGEKVNLECDIVGKYVEKLMGINVSTEHRRSNITEEFLMENGFC